MNNKPRGRESLQTFLSSRVNKLARSCGERILIGSFKLQWRGLVVDARLSDREVRSSSPAFGISAGRRLVLEKGYLHTFLRLTHALNEYPTIGSERSCQNARVMRLTSCSSVGSEGEQAFFIMLVVLSKSMTCDYGKRHAAPCYYTCHFHFEAGP
ncbi:hypothetical protein ElyMa_002414900 [Elysia marginata]|uniref:Uncharacterized protein n=1 Tax=Elysia marginata TaxID=1093978 RepID=A0AAV4GFZ1_9GAST|nr:hypothetical protein ElyMa_002414900 [Elysia marginata]